MQNELRRKAKEDKPKQAKTGYHLFANHLHDQVKEALTADLAEGEKRETRAKGLRAAVDQTPERAVSVVPGGEADGQAKRECVACGTKTTPQWRYIESKAYCVSP